MKTSNCNAWHFHREQVGWHPTSQIHLVSKNTTLSRSSDYHNSPRSSKISSQERDQIVYSFTIRYLTRSTSQEISSTSTVQRSSSFPMERRQSSMARGATSLETSSQVKKSKKRTPLITQFFSVRSVNTPFTH